MVTVKLTSGDDEIEFRPIVISSISLDRALLGSSVRALDGSLLTYIGGAKKENIVTVTADINQALMIQDWEADGRTVAIEIEDHAGVEIADYNCVLADVGVSYSQTEGMAELSFTAREI